MRLRRPRAARAPPGAPVRRGRRPAGGRSAGLGAAGAARGGGVGRLVRPVPWSRRGSVGACSGHVQPAARAVCHRRPPTPPPPNSPRAGGPPTADGGAPLGSYVGAAEMRHRLAGEFRTRWRLLGELVDNVARWTIPAMYLISLIVAVVVLA